MGNDVNKSLIERVFERVGYVKAKTIERASAGYHEDESQGSLLDLGKKYYKDPTLAYEEHPWVYSAVWAVANAAAMLPVKMYQLDNDRKKVDVLDHWLLDLLKFPNPYYTGYDLIEGTFTYLELLGDSYWEVVRNSLGRMVAFYLMRSDRVEVVGDEKNLVKGYIYTPNVKRYNMMAADVIHFKNFSPRSEINGQASVKAATSSLEADYLGNEYFKDFYRRGAELSFAIEVPHRLGEASYKRLRGTLRKKHQGVGKFKDVLIMEEGAHYIATETAPKDAGESETSIRARRSVAGVVGVPPIKLQLLEGSTYANARFQDLGFWRNTMMPRLKKFYAKITLDCLRNAGAVEWIEPDLSKELMNIDEFLNEVSAYSTAIGSGLLKRNEARDKLGYGTVPGGDKLTVAPNLMPLEDLVGLSNEGPQEEG